tara:strand:+ start:883 stop:1413 length:531 start_codon:yes stop_codon:yes gene_type:complete
MGYCEAADVGIRLGLDSGQRDRAATRITSAIRRAGISIDQEFRNYGRNAPSSDIAESTLNGAISAGATTITLADASSFSTAGNGSIDGDSFKWSGKSSNDLTGVTGVSYDHNTATKVVEGEMAHVIKEICADLAASIYLEDETMFHTSGADPVRSNVLRQRATMNLTRLAHLGSVD